MLKMERIFVTEGGKNMQGIGLNYRLERVPYLVPVPHLHLKCDTYLVRRYGQSFKSRNYNFLKGVMLNAVWR
jgi:hypothetical protein